MKSALSAQSPVRTPADRALARILQVWRPQYVRLIVGVAIAELAVCAGLALMGQAGGRLTGAAIGAGVGYLLLRLSGIAQILLRYAERLYTHDAMFRALADLRVWFYRRLAGGAAAGLGFQRSGDLLSRLVSDVQTLDNLYLRILVPLISAVLTLPITLFVWLRAGIAAGLLMGVAFALLAFALPLLGARLSNRFGPSILRAEADLRVAALDLASGLREARAFGAESMLADRVLKQQEVLFAAQRRQGLRMAMMQGLAGIIAKAGIIVCLCSVAGLLFPQAPAVAGVTALFVAITALEGVSGLSRAGLLAGQVTHAAERIVEIADRAPPAPDGTSALPRGRDVLIQNVTFRWSSDRAPIFEDLTLTLREGERVALIGPSGAGKSSLAALMLKAASPERGAILLGGSDIASLRNADLRTQVAWLSQSSHLFDDTVRGNLLLGRDDLSEESLWSALEQARIADVVQALPNGLDTWIGEGGSMLSGGQGRRIALARVLLSDAPILVLDEPATGLDADTERAFLETLNTATQGRSVLMIAHRLTGVENVDRIWRLENGRVISQQR